MEVKPGYKQTDVGVIPDEWDVGGLGQFWSVTDCKHLTAEFVPIGFPIASIKEVKSRFVDLTNANQTTQHFYESLIEGGRKPQPGDLILSRNATVGDVAQVADWHPAFAMGQDVCLLRKRSPDFSTDFIQAVFQSPVVANQLSNLMVGSTFKRANIEQIRSFSVPMPQAHEQRAIAETLSDVNALLVGLDRLIARKSDLKQAAMQQLLTGQIRLPGFSGPWDTKRLKDILRVRHGRSQQGITAPDGKYPILASGGEIGRAHSYIYDKPSVLIGRKGTIDSPQYMDSPFWTVDTLFFTEISSQADAKFVFYKFTAIPWRSYNEASGVPSLNAKTIENIELQIPQRAEQTAITDVLIEMDEELAALKQRREKSARSSKP